MAGRALPADSLTDDDYDDAEEEVPTMIMNDADFAQPLPSWPTGWNYEREKITGSIDEQAEAHRRLNAIVGDLQLDLAERRGIGFPLNTRVVKQNLPSKLRRR